MPKIEAESVSEQRKLVQRRVFDAFAALMAGHTYDAITMAMIAAHATLGRTAIYHHFHDKEAVVVAFATHETQRYVEQLQAALGESDDPEQRLRIYVRHHLAAGEQFHMGLGPQLFGVLPASSRAAIRTHVVAVEDVLRTILLDGTESGAFTVADLDGTLSLIHACLGPRHLAPGTVEQFVLGAVGAAGRG